MLFRRPGTAGGYLHARGNIQVFRFLPETLSTSRKYGCVHDAGITFTYQDRQVRITIQNDGLEFDPDTVPASVLQHFGLQFMQERAAELGGSVQV